MPSPDREAEPPDGTSPLATPDPMHEIVGRVRQITRENERLFARLIEGERRFRGLAKAVWKVQEDERRRLARELHDGLGQTLTALTHQLERLQSKLTQGAPTELAPALADSVEIARGALQEIRELSRLLRPPVLDDLGLPAALSWLARSLGQRTGLKIEVDCAGLDKRLDAEIETVAFRLVQEALTNVLRHAAAERAWVAMSRSSGRLSLRVEDDGGGCDVEAALAGRPDASGLRGMRDRLELFGGRLELSSEKGLGTVVAATLRLDEEG